MEKTITDGIYIISDFLSNINLEDFQNLPWCEMTINNKVLQRRGCFMGTRDLDKVVPWLRCPSIENQTIHEKCDLVLNLEKYIEKLGYNTNIYKIQEYRNGQDTIYPHSDKIIDLDENTPIFIARFGATRTMILINKITKEELMVPVPHNSLVVISYQANKLWKHGIIVDNDIQDPSYSIVARKSVTFTFNESSFVHGDRVLVKDPVWSREQQKTEMVRCFNQENNGIHDVSLYKNIIDHCIYKY